MRVNLDQKNQAGLLNKNRNIAFNGLSSAQLKNLKTETITSAMGFLTGYSANGKVSEGIILGFFTTGLFDISKGQKIMNSKNYMDISAKYKNPQPYNLPNIIKASIARRKEVKELLSSLSPLNISKYIINRYEYPVVYKSKPRMYPTSKDLHASIAPQSERINTNLVYSNPFFGL